MKGVVFNLLEEIVSAEHGEDAWDAIVDAAEVDGVYTSLGSYPDGELQQLVAAASQALGVPADDVVRWFGRATVPLFARRYRPLFDAHRALRPFVLGLNDFIHPEVQKLYPGAVTPHFRYDTSVANVLVLEYRSERQLCAFAEGLLHGAGDHYGQPITIERPTCLKRGDDHCTLTVAGA